VNDNVESKMPRSLTAGVAVIQPDTLCNGLPSHENVAVLAYSYWEARGCPDGSPEEDWTRAEQELLDGLSQDKAEP
jgi:hypothetical protein